MDTLDLPVKYAWRPRSIQQQAFIEWPGFEACYGGSRGGGKSDASLGLNAIRAGRYRDAYRGLFLRKHLTDLEDAITRAKEIYFPVGAEWHEQKKKFTFPGGGELTFAYLKADKDAEKYQGRNLTDVSVEELTQIADSKPIMKLAASLRSAHGVPCQFRATCNPGGPGHSWVKSRYIDPAPLGFKPIVDPETGLDRVFIPSRVWDNKALMEADPGYINRLKMSAGGSEALLKAWLYGDWDAIEGAYFDNWDQTKHVIHPFEIPKHWLRFRSMDWGSAVPFAILWFAVSDGEEFETPSGQKLWFPRGALIVYREYYGMADGQPNVGLKLTAEQVCEGGQSTIDGKHHKGIVEREKGDEINYGVASPDMFKQDGGPSVAERHFKCGVLWRSADNRRVARHGAIGGWDQVRSRLNGIDKNPMLYVFSNCIHLIRTLPIMQHDPDRPEDVADGEDHGPEALRYGCMSRPWTVEQPAKPKEGVGTTFMQAVRQIGQRGGSDGRV